MVLERFLMKVFAPRRLARRDARLVFEQIEFAKNHTQRGSMIGYSADIPEHDLRGMLLLMERQGYIERDPGPFDAPYTPDLLKSWWCPGKHYLEGIRRLGPNR